MRAIFTLENLPPAEKRAVSQDTLRKNRLAKHPLGVAY